MNLSPHFTLAEFVTSQTAARLGIDNTPGPVTIANLRKTAATLERVRSLLGGVPIIVTSGYRCPKLNKAIGGSATSAHMTGMAVDFIAPRYGSPYKIAKAIVGSEIPFDQVIHEFGTWVHLGLTDRAGRNQALSIFNGTGYKPGILEA